MSRKIEDLDSITFQSGLLSQVEKDGTAYQFDLGALAAGFDGTSTTSLTMGSGSQTLTTQAGLAYAVGSRIRVIEADNSAIYLEGVVTSYSGTTLVFDCDFISTSGGPYSTWTVTIAGDRGATGSTGASDGADRNYGFHGSNRSNRSHGFHRSNRSNRSNRADRNYGFHGSNGRGLRRKFHDKRCD